MGLWRGKMGDGGRRDERLGRPQTGGRIQYVCSCEVPERELSEPRNIVLDGTILPGVTHAPRVSPSRFPRVARDDAVSRRTRGPWPTSTGGMPTGRSLKSSVSARPSSSLPSTGSGSRGGICIRPSTRRSRMGWGLLGGRLGPNIGGAGGEGGV